jgi:glycosyltransferase involved in cell wall biosynthesis
MGSPAVDALVSIVITSYNYARYLPHAIESALAQDYVPLEVLVLDNASTDETPAVLERYAADPRFRAIRNDENIGLTPNHNKGLREARGEYILFLSADDRLIPGCITRAMRYYEQHPEIDILYGGIYFMDENGHIYGQRMMTGQTLCAYAGGRNEIAGVLGEGCYMCTPTMLVRRSIWEEHGGWDEELHGADYEISARWASRGLRFGYLPEPLAVVRLHPEQHSGDREYVHTGRHMREYLTILDRYLDPAHPEWVAGYEQVIRRLLDAREYWYNRSFPEAYPEAEPQVSALRSRLTAIAARNANRVRRRICYVVVVENTPGPLENTLRSLVAQTEPGWRAVVVQRPYLTYEPLCRMIDPVRVAHAHMMMHLATSVNLNTAFRMADADIYNVVRAGTILAPDHAASVIEAFADPAARIVVSWPRFFIEPPSGDFSPAIEIPELSVPPSGAFDVLVGPEVAPEAVAVAREMIDVLAGYNQNSPALIDWEFLIRATLHAPNSFRGGNGGVEVHVSPETHEFMPTGPATLALIEQMHVAYPVTDPARLNARTAYLERLRAARRFDPSTQAGLADFFRTLARTGVTI